MNSWDKDVIKSQTIYERKTLKELKAIYKKASQDLEENIKELAVRYEESELQSIIYQKKYQEAIKKQVDKALSNLMRKEYTSIDDFLNESYKNGYIGSIFSLHKQDIPLILPIDGEQVIKALRTDSKLSRRYYKGNPLRGRIEENYDLLKTRVRTNLSRGIAQGQSWQKIAKNIASGMNSPLKRAMNDSMRIARTEGHRIHQQGFLNAGSKAKKKGANILKQWDATLDGRTRDEHREIDGTIIEWDEYFDVGGEKMEAPSIGGSARNVVNCRCCLLQRAKWALDDKELETLKERAKYFGLDKSSNFADFKKKYLNVVENISQGGNIISNKGFSNGLNNLVNVKTNNDIEVFAEDLINNLKIDRTNITISVKAITDHGHCVLGKGTTKDIIHYEEYVLNANDKRSMTHRIKTAFHESFHLYVEGMEWDGLDSSGKIKEAWRSLEETFTESSAHYMLKKYGVTEKIAPSYPKELAKNLPRLKQLPKYSSCNTIQDFGEIAFTDRQNGVSAKWIDLSKKMKKVKLDNDYYKQYHTYITDNEDDLFDMFLGNMPGFEQYRADMKLDLKSAMNKDRTLLNDNEEIVYYGILSCAMQKVGVK